MKKLLAFVMLFFIFACMTLYAQRVNIQNESPMYGWRWNTGQTLNGRFFFYVSESYREQSGFALIEGRRWFYWLYDTISFHGGNASEIYNKYLQSWVEELGYVIDYDNIQIFDPNPGLASSVQALMQQQGTDVSVTIGTGPIGSSPRYDIDYLYVNEWFPSRRQYKTTVYPLIIFYQGF